MTGKERILQAALRLFAEKGYTETRTSEIARQAEISEPMIFKHFQSKQNLLKLLVVQSHELHDAMVRRVEAETKGDLETIEGLVVGVIDLATKNRHHYLLMARVCAFRRNDPELPCGRLAEESSDLLLASLQRAIQHGVDQGRFFSLPVDATAKAFMSMAYGAIRLQVLGKVKNNELSEALIQCIRARLLPPAG